MTLGIRGAGVVQNFSFRALVGRGWPGCAYVRTPLPGGGAHTHAHAHAARVMGVPDACGRVFSSPADVGVRTRARASCGGGGGGGWRWIY